MGKAAAFTRIDRRVNSMVYNAHAQSGRKACGSIRAQRAAPAPKRCKALLVSPPLDLASRLRVFPRLARPPLSQRRTNHHNGAPINDVRAFQRAPVGFTGAGGSAVGANPKDPLSALAACKTFSGFLIETLISDAIMVDKETN